MRRAARIARRDQRGGAVSLWVVLMVPVSAFAAVVAMAGPQRLAAESSVQEAADDLAMFTVAWRDGAQDPKGPLAAFPPDCAARTAQQQADMTALDGKITALDPEDGAFLTDLGMLDLELEALRASFRQQPSWGAVAGTSQELKADLRDRYDKFEELLGKWDAMCDFLFEALLRDLGNLGVDMGSLRGSYSDSLKDAAALPCLVAIGRSAPRADVVVSDAAHVALAADWQDAGWAAAQVWPDGLPMAAESIGRLSQYDHTNAPPGPCDRKLVVLDSQGRPVWATDPAAPSRQMVQSAPRSVLAG